MVELGAEVYYFSGISDSEVVSELSIAGEWGILVEMPPAPWTDSMYRELEDLALRRGFTPVIAHVDRYISPLRTHGIPKRLAQLPVLVQANAHFFTGKLTRLGQLPLGRQPVSKQLQRLLFGHMDMTAGSFQLHKQILHHRIY